MFLASRSTIFRNLLKQVPVRNMCSATTSGSGDAYSSYQTLLVEQPHPFVFHVQMNRPDKMNAMNPQMWTEIGQCFERLSDDANCRVIVFSGRGKIFTAGLDLMSAMGLAQDIADVSDVARRGHILARKIRAYQETVTSLEACAKPVLAAVHSGCLGAGVDLITAADIRYCTSDAWFCVKEVDIGMAADVGTLQRLPKVIGNQSLVRELCMTARKMKSDEAASHGLVSQVFATQDAMIKHAIETAALIASKSPVAVQATKKSLNYSQDRTTQEGLDQIYEMNKLLLQSEDFASAAMAQATKGDPPVFAKL